MSYSLPVTGVKSIFRHIEKRPIRLLGGSISDITLGKLGLRRGSGLGKRRSVVMMRSIWSLRRREILLSVLLFSTQPLGLGISFCLGPCPLLLGMVSICIGLSLSTLLLGILGMGMGLSMGFMGEIFGRSLSKSLGRRSELILGPPVGVCRGGIGKPILWGMEVITLPAVMVRICTKPFAVTIGIHGVAGTSLSRLGWPRSMLAAGFPSPRFSGRGGRLS
jgi:hypothetical protein